MDMHRESERLIKSRWRHGRHLYYCTIDLFIVLLDDRHLATLRGDIEERIRLTQISVKKSRYDSFVQHVQNMPCTDMQSSLLYSGIEVDVAAICNMCYASAYKFAPLKEWTLLSESYMSESILCLFLLIKVLSKSPLVQPYANRLFLHFFINRNYLILHENDFRAVKS